MTALSQALAASIIHEQAAKNLPRPSLAAFSSIMYSPAEQAERHAAAGELYRAIQILVDAEKLYAAKAEALADYRRKLEAFRAEA